MILVHSIHNGVLMVATKILDHVNLRKLCLAFDNLHLILLKYHATFCDLRTLLTSPYSCTHFLWIYWFPLALLMRRKQCSNTFLHCQLIWSGCPKSWIVCRWCSTMISGSGVPLSVELAKMSILFLSKKQRHCIID